MATGSVILLHKICFMWDVWLRHWLLPISLRWNGVWIVYFAHPYLTFNSPCRLYLFLSLFLSTIALVFPIRVAVKRPLQKASFWGVYHAYAKYVSGLWTYFEPFLVDSSRKKNPSVIPASTFIFWSPLPFCRKPWMRSVKSPSLSNLIMGVCRRVIPKSTSDWLVKINALS